MFYRALKTSLSFTCLVKISLSTKWFANEIKKEQFKRNISYQEDSTSLYKTRVDPSIYVGLFTSHHKLVF